MGAENFTDQIMMTAARVGLLVVALAAASCRVSPAIEQETAMHRMNVLWLDVMGLSMDSAIPVQRFKDEVVPHLPHQLHAKADQVANGQIDYTEFRTMVQDSVRSPTEYLDKVAM